MHIAGEREVGVGAASLEKAAAWPSGRSLEAAQMGLHEAFVKGARMDDSRSQGRDRRGSGCAEDECLKIHMMLVLKTSPVQWCLFFF